MCSLQWNEKDVEMVFLCIQDFQEKKRKKWEIKNSRNSTTINIWKKMEKLFKLKFSSTQQHEEEEGN